MIAKQIKDAAEFYEFYEVNKQAPNALLINPFHFDDLYEAAGADPSAVFDCGVLTSFYGMQVVWSSIVKEGKFFVTYVKP